MALYSKLEGWFKNRTHISPLSYVKVYFNVMCSTFLKLKTMFDHSEVKDNVCLTQTPILRRVENYTPCERSIFVEIQLEGAWKCGHSWS